MPRAPVASTAPRARSVPPTPSARAKHLTPNPPDEPVPLVRGKQLRSRVRRRGARLAHAFLVQAVREQGLTHGFLAARLEVPQTWVEDVLAGRISAALGDAFVFPRSLRRALGLALMSSAENDNQPGSHG